MAGYHIPGTGRLAASGTRKMKNHVWTDSHRLGSFCHFYIGRRTWSASLGISPFWYFFGKSTSATPPAHRLGSFCRNGLLHPERWNSPLGFSAFWYPMYIGIRSIREQIQEPFGLFSRSAANGVTFLHWADWHGARVRQSRLRYNPTEGGQRIKSR